MKKLIMPILVACVLTACKTEVEKEVSLNTLLNEPIKTETALLNVEIPSCSSHEDSRLPSDNLVKIQSQIPTVFPNAKYKECFKKRFDSFASFEIPIGVGKVEENTILENDINIYSYKNRKLNIKTSAILAENIRNFVLKEHISNLQFNIIITLNNDTSEDQQFTVLSAYRDGQPLPFQTMQFKKGKKHQIRLSDVSADTLWQYRDSARIVVLTSPFELDEVIK